MKNPLDPRHLRRKKAVKELFSWGYRKEGSVKKLSEELAKKVISHLKKIDKIISQSAPEWPTSQINRIDLAILRLAIYEINIAAKEPPKAIIDEAVELAKTYGGEKSPAFINGVLGTVFKKQIKKIKKDEKP